MRHLTAAFIALIILAGLAACAGRADPAYPQSASPRSRDIGGQFGVDRTAPSAAFERQPATVEGQPTMGRDLGQGGGGERLGAPGRTETGPAGWWTMPERMVRDQPQWDWQETATIALGLPMAGDAPVRAALRDQRRWPESSVVDPEVFANLADPGELGPAATSAGALRLMVRQFEHPWRPGTRLLAMAVRASPVQRGPVDVVWCVDVSPTMARRDRMALVRAALDRLVDGLHAQDRVALVTYAGERITAVAPAMVGDGTALRARIAALRADGSSGDAAPGLRRAFSTAHRHARPGVPGHVLWLCDGEVSDAEALASRIDQDAAGIGMTAVAVRPDERGAELLDRCVRAAGGEALAVHDPVQARRLVGERVVGLLAPAAHQARLQVIGPPGTRLALIGWSSRRMGNHQFGNAEAVAAPLPSGTTLVAFAELTPLGGSGTAQPPRVRLAWLEPGGSTLQQIQAEPAAATPLAQAEAGWRFAVAVTTFGQVLAGDRLSRPWTLYHMARAAAGPDPDPARADVLDLMAQAAEVAP